MTSSMLLCIYSQTCNYKINEVWSLCTPVLRVDDENDDNGTCCNQYDGEDNNRDSNGHGLVTGQSIGCCICKNNMQQAYYNLRQRKLQVARSLSVPKVKVL